MAQVAHLGCWKSHVILDYAEEALEQRPANLNLQAPSVDQKGAPVVEHQVLSDEELSEWKAQLRKEIELLKVSWDKKDNENSELMNYWVDFHKENPNSLPQRVQSYRPRWLSLLEHR